MYFKICMSLGNSFRQWFLTLVRVLSRPTAHNWITGQMPVKVNVISEEIHFSGIFSFFLKHRALPLKTIQSLYPKERHLLLNLLLERSDPFAKCGGLLDQSSPDIYVRKNLFPFIFVSTHSNVSYVMYISNIALQQNQAGFVGYLCTCYWKSRSNVNLANFR